MSANGLILHPGEGIPAGVRPRWAVFVFGLDDRPIMEAFTTRRPEAIEYADRAIERPDVLRVVAVPIYSRKGVRPIRRGER